MSVGTAPWRTSTLSLLLDWLAILAGVLLLAFVWSDRRELREAWRQPARWWSRDPLEAFESRTPAQPLNVVVALVLGITAIVFGVLSVVT
jgi:hypothetical protein